ncbi:hypothetical protein [Achromobacter xylosoxidans]|uniref:hypothetical protein n=1 Tax=Alcaligenes xylosoxydans xylosoxydans TaxID=85698 RepID=UPI000B491EF2|nr:hypothetical protein [Achromobacter xylosoxidans]
MQEEQTAMVKMGIGAGGAVFYGLTLNEWVALATLVYLALQIGLLMPKYWRLLRGWWRGEKA